MTCHITDDPSSRIVYHVCVSVTNPLAHFHSRSTGSNSPYNSSGEKREETGRKLGACGSTAGADLSKSSRMASLGPLNTYEKNDENMVYWVRKGEEMLHEPSLYRDGPGLPVRAMSTHHTHSHPPNHACTLQQ